MIPIFCSMLAHMFAQHTQLQTLQIDHVLSRVASRHEDNMGSFKLAATIERFRKDAHYIQLQQHKPWDQQWFDQLVQLH